MSNPKCIRLDSPSTLLRPAPTWVHAPAKPQMLLRCDSRTRISTLITNQETGRQWTDPLEALQWMCDWEGPTGIRGTWIGYLSYDLGRLFESLPAVSEDDLQLPLFCFTYHHNLIGPGLAYVPEDYELGHSPLRSSFTRRAYLNAVQRSIDYIRAGDIFQVNLSQRFTAGLPAQPQEIYDRLRDQSPAWYGGYLDFGDHALICNSPELFLRVAPPRADCSRAIITRPIKGTRPRLAGMEAALRDSIKDQAELNMIVDLERNDLGRVCEIGSVKVTQPREIEAHPTIYHGVATIEGTLRPNVTFVDLLRATFPGGSVTGAPKIRAMEIIEELEPTRRGPYCGAIGYLAPDGTMEFNIAIRTMIVKDGLVHIPVGGGIVADSNPGEEYNETLVKARAMFAALGLSVDDLEQ